MRVGAIILAGGQGLRMGGDTPKQFLMLNGLPVALHSLRIFEQIPSIEQVVIVADPNYHHLFSSAKSLQFALPGKRRQDSLFHGLQVLGSDIDYVCVHDAARPFITQVMVETLIKAGIESGAATTAMPLKFTVKEAASDGRVKSTPDRSRLWEIQTPQLVRRDLLDKGFELAYAQGVTVTDDVSLVELFHHPVQLVRGSYSNIKITTFDDWILAENIVRNLYSKVE